MSVTGLVPARYEPCRCLDDDEYGRNPDGECFCYDTGSARCSCSSCQDAARWGREELR